MKLQLEIEVEKLDEQTILKAVEPKINEVLLAAVVKKLGEMERFFRLDELAVRSRWENAWKDEVARLAAKEVQKLTVAVTVVPNAS